jgi:hypothetical protein
MNISYAESPLTVIAKTYGCKDADTKKVTYTFIDFYHNLCLDKKDIILAEIEEASERLLKYISDKDDEDRKLVEKEIAELKMAPGFMS